jgi:hypothetical protein
MPQSGLWSKSLNRRLPAGVLRRNSPAGTAPFEGRIGPLELGGVRMGAQQATPAVAVPESMQGGMKTHLVAAAGVIALAGSPQVQPVRGTVNKWPEQDPVISAFLGVDGKVYRAERL